jgi:hypothetical protein
MLADADSLLEFSSNYSAPLSQIEITAVQAEFIVRACTAVFVYGEAAAIDEVKAAVDGLLATVAQAF